MKNIFRKICQVISIIQIVSYDSNAQIISTIAGNGNSAYSGDGNLATNASLDSPKDICLDNLNNVYITDYYNQCIRKINASTGIISTIAGNGSIGFSGDGGLATNSTLAYPTGIFIDLAGNIFVTANQRIRKINAATGIINTIAGNGTQGAAGDGGLATNAQLNNPAGIFVDRVGNIYLADSYNNKIRKIDGSTGVINTIAGNGSQSYSGDGGIATNAGLYYPFGICADTTGNVYFADQYNHRIRKISVSTGIITTIAGSNSGGFSGDGGAAINAKLYYPNGISIDASNNLYIGDFSNLRVRKIDLSTGNISTIAGNGILGYTGDGGIATNAESGTPVGVFVDAVGNIYFSDATYSVIRKISTITSGKEVQTSPFSKNKIYPNPTFNCINIQSDQIEFENSEIEITNYLGQSVLKCPYSTNFSVSTLSSGYYILKILTSHGQYQSSFIKE